jgi:predicted ATPase
LQVALITPLIHVKGYAASETRIATERARLLIEQAEAFGEPPEDPLLLFSLLYSSWVANLVAFNGDMVRKLAVQFLALAEKQGMTFPLVIGHRLLGMSLALVGDLTQGRAHFDRAMALYDPAAHRPLATRFGHDVGVSILSYRSLAVWALGHVDAALADADHALRDARGIGEAATLMYALLHSAITHILCRNYATANAQSDELVALADEKGAATWKALGMLMRGSVFALTRKAPDAVQVITSSLTAYRSSGATLWMPTFVSYLASAHAELGQFDEALRCTTEARAAVEATEERLHEAEVNRIAGEIALMSPERDTAKAEANFEWSLAVARQQQAKSWELRAAMSMARLWRSQGKSQQARELLAPVYGWFTEGFDTLDLKRPRRC